MVTVLQIWENFEQDEVNVIGAGSLGRDTNWNRNGPNER